MLSYKFLFDIALILMSTKVLGLITKKFKMPQVVGALLAGLILGPAVFNVIEETNFIQQISELGVIILMFTAGLEIDINQLKKTGKVSLVVALAGVLIPLLGGTILGFLFNRGELSDNSGNAILQNIFIGIILTATSVSITVETLKELGKLKTRAGNTILAAALIDDILGIIALTIVSSFKDTSVNILVVLLKILLFFVFAAIIGYIFYRLFTWIISRYKSDMRRFVILAFVFCLLLAYVAERFFGVADITGAFIAGLIISNTKVVKYLNNRFETLSYMLLSPIFFASIGLKVQIPEMSSLLIMFAVLVIIVGILSKIIGGVIGAKLCKYSRRESLQIGVGMVTRGEVALIVANKGIALGIMNPIFLGPIIIMVIVTAVTTPILLKIVFK